MKDLTKKIEEIARDTFDAYVGSIAKSSSCDPNLLAQSIDVLTSKDRNVLALSSIPENYRILASQALFNIVNSTSNHLNRGYYSFLSEYSGIIDVINKKAKEGFQELKIALLPNSIKLSYLNSNIVVITFSVLSTHVQVSCSGNVKCLNKEEDRKRAREELLDKLRSVSEGKPIIFSDASSSRTFSSLFKDLIPSVIQVFGSSKNPRTGNFMQFGILAPEKAISVDNEAINPDSLVRRGFTALCGGCYITVNFGVSSSSDAERAIREIEKSMIADKKGIAIVAFGEDCDSELLEEHGVKLVPHTTNLYYYELYK